MLRMAAKSTTYTVELQAVRLIPAVLGLERELVIEVLMPRPWHGLPHAWVRCLTVPTCTARSLSGPQGC